MKGRCNSMKLMFISDIHGSQYYLNKILERYAVEEPDYIVILGDILYHGPRNDLPKGYNPKGVLEELNKLKEVIIAVKGNCDGEVDQMVLEFPMMNDYTIILYNNKRIFATHGHKYNCEKMPNLSIGDIFVSGHTHIPVTEKKEGIYFINPGSISIPRNNKPNSYGVLTEDRIDIKDLDGKIYKTINIE
jgi:putative phosphoesterase